jgi:hypothetical protein
VTPQTDDEQHFRRKLSLPAMSSDAKRAWADDEGTRRPITLTPPPGTQTNATTPIAGNTDDANA